MSGGAWPIVFYNPLKIRDLSWYHVRAERTVVLCVLSISDIFCAHCGLGNDLFELWQLSIKKVETQSGGESFSSSSAGAPVSL